MVNDKKDTAKNKKDILIGFSIFALDNLLFYFLWKNNTLLTIAFLFISAFILLGWSDRREKIIYFTSFIFGPVIDLTVAPTGIWVYGNPTIFNIPLWLPLVYGIFGVILVKMGNSIARLM